MSFLYPLFLAGITAVGLPIILHMIRRHTRKRVTFSSLMFLRTTLPRFKNRSRLENLPLLTLRCVILCLLALGFSRPFFFFWRPAPESQVHLGRRIVLLIDTSASMRRAGMWNQAISQAQSILEGESQADRVCVMSFDQSPRTLIGFDEWADLDPSQRVSIVLEYISNLSPGWASTDLGLALTTAAEAIEDDEVNPRFRGDKLAPAEAGGQQSIAVRQVTVISDMQQGSSVSSLGTYEWPEGVQLIVKLIRPLGNTNASLQLVTNAPDSIGGHLASRDGNDPSAGLRACPELVEGAGLLSIRIANSPDAAKEFFSLNWAGSPAGSGTNIYVPAGHSIVVRVPTLPDWLAGGKLILTGDDHDFDNTLYLAPHLQQQVNILYVGSDDANDSGGMLYYVQRAFPDFRFSIGNWQLAIGNWQLAINAGHCDSTFDHYCGRWDRGPLRAFARKQGGVRAPISRIWWDGSSGYEVCGCCHNTGGPCRDSNH